MGSKIQRSRFPLAKYFALPSLVAFVIVAMLLGAFSRSIAIGNLMDIEEQRSITLARHTRSSVWPEFGPELERASDLTPSELAQSPFVQRMGAAIYDEIRGLNVIKVKVYNRQGITVYSTDPAQIGEDMASNAGFQSALAGQVASELVYRDSISGFDGTYEAVDVLSSYVAIRDETTGTPLGVFELYLDVTPFLAQIDRTQSRLLLGVFVFLGLLYSVLFIVVRQAYGIVKRHDVERQHWAEAQLAAKQEAEAANRTKSGFLATMSHELRTPLNAIIGYSELLSEESVDRGMPEMVEDLQRIRTAGNHLLTLINNVLDLSKIEAGKMDFTPESFDIKALVVDVGLTARPLIARNGNTFEIRCPDDIGRMSTDAVKLRQVLFNLLSNAAKFTSAGQIHVAVARESDAEGRWVRFEVADTGEGIDPAELDRIFDDFSQAHSASVRPEQGTGLGLAISHRFVEMMGGTLTVESTPGIGSVFTFRLPITMSAPATDMPGNGAGRDVVNGQRRLVLVIDDDPLALDVLRRWLEREGFRTAIASSGEEGLRLARKLHPDAITLDVMLPEMDGWQVLAELKGDKSLQDIPVIMITISTERSQGIALGVADHLVKPIDFDRLGRSLRTCLGEDSTGRIILVCTDFEIRRHLTEVLEREGWEVIPTASSDEAIAAAARVTPNLVMLNVTSEGADGLGALHALRAQSVFKGVPFIVVTSRKLAPEEHERLLNQVELILDAHGLAFDQLQHEVGRVVRRWSRQRGEIST